MDYLFRRMYSLPLKVYYGKGVYHSLTEVLNPEWIDGIELGLSSDTNMADQIKNCISIPFCRIPMPTHSEK